ncbi:vWA domain-containing protein [Cognatiyoonia sp. IB215182]|uniref:vWA domain-containing protein n=1 Tax=Cognatiyoonia sp. IB215182 TaxID=3097353 RepID=UPI002A1386E9|nr:vWA domain-containing protein [Cognatiyoonia sp. IB215182]MDX8353766.1 VWA domain-containing protein [Cognatiyoonia sp. IB215182]
MLEPRKILLGPVVAFALSACSGVAPGSGTYSGAAAVLPSPSVAPVAPEAAIAAPIVQMPPAATRATPQAGVVTAGDVDDALNLTDFLRYQGQAAQELGLPAAALQRPVLAQLRGPDGAPAPGVRVTLRALGAARPFYDGYSVVEGLLTVFPAALGQTRLNAVEMRAFVGDADPVVTQLRTGTERQTVRLPSADGWAPDFLDLVFAVDTTGSMQDELDWLAQEIRQITRDAQRTVPGVDIRLGLIVYKAPADPYVVRSYGFTRSPREFARWVRSEQASGGAGGPEVVADALTAAVDMNWRRGRGERLLFQIGDEPPTEAKTELYYRAAARAAAEGIQVFSVAASGVDPHLEFLMRQGAAMTGGRYVFLTDDSGVGLAHAEPTISCYQVTRLNELLARILRSELSGLRIEAAPADVIRTVGSYQNGRCLN